MRDAASAVNPRKNIPAGYKIQSCRPSHIGLGLYSRKFSQNLGGISGGGNVLRNMRYMVPNRAEFISFWAPEKNSREMLLQRAKFSYGEVEIFLRGGWSGATGRSGSTPQPPIQRLNSCNLFICRPFCHLPSSTWTHIRSSTYSTLNTCFWYQKRQNFTKFCEMRFI